MWLFNLIGYIRRQGQIKSGRLHCEGQFHHLAYFECSVWCAAHSISYWTFGANLSNVLFLLTQEHVVKYCSGLLYKISPQVLLWFITNSLL